MPEQQAFDFGERQDADDAAVALRQQVMRAMAKSLFDDGFPAGAMEKRGLRAGFDKGVPLFNVGGRK